MSRILIIEDDADIAQLVKLYLEKAGHTVEAIDSGELGVSRLRDDPPDLLILDVMLPGVDGLTLCRDVRARAATAAIPIIILSARADESDRIHGLELGADDYVVKPFSPKELVARVAALERRTRPLGADTAPLHYGALTMDRDRHRVVSGGREVSLTAKEFLLLEYFLRHCGRVVSRERLLTDVWGYRYAGGTRTVDVHVRRLRKKLPALCESLATVHQFGYKLLDRATDPDPAVAQTGAM
jgi:two-component system alkaline phosphatase synthesis response regulator PhoP